MSKEQILVTPQQDLCAVVADAPKNSEIVLAPGKYILNRPLVVDKTIFMRSQTGKVKDVMIGRDNATVLFVIDGKPTFHGIEFFAPASSDDAPANTNEYDSIDAFMYKSAVAVREKGNATFIECKASSRQKSAFSARGKKAFITLDKCWVPQTGEGGIFVDDKACGLVKNCLIQNTGLGCVDVETNGSKLTVENSTLEKSRYGALSPHDDGLLVVRKCKINVGVTFGAVVRNGRLEVEDSAFVSDLNESSLVDLQSRFGVMLLEGSAKLTDCSMSKLIIGVFMATPNSKLEMKRVEMDEGMLTSVVFDPESPKIKISDCKLAEPPLEKDYYLEALKRWGADDGEDPEGSRKHLPDVAKWSEANFSDEQKKRAYDLKTKYFEKILGEEFMLCIESDEPFYEGGRLNLYYYTKSRYGGTFLISKQLASPEFSRPSFEGVNSFELAIASRKPFYYDENGNPRPDYDKVVKPYELLYGVLTLASLYIWDESPVARYNTIELPDGKNTLYFIFDLIDEPEMIEVDSNTRDALGDYSRQNAANVEEKETLSLDDALMMYSDSESERQQEEKTNSPESTKRSFGVLVMIALHKSELDYIRAHEGASKIFLQKLKEQNRWPFSDLERPPIF